MKNNYVLIDYENVQPKSLAALRGEHVFKVYLFVGASQTKVTFEVAEAMQALGEHAKYIKISGNGPNALDFHIAYYIGQLAAQDPNAFFHIISKDSGFDPLIKHLKGQKVFACRSKDVGDIPMLKVGHVAKSGKVEDKLALVLANLRQRGAAKPRSVKTLVSTIGALFSKQLNEEEVSTLVEGLKDGDYINVVGTKVSYSL
ncbi:MAG: hypothetical protein B7X39_03315 [Lysobacterales bacterium 14-68-21]|jgi:hypothetical protein|nr:MAG: hypothetical protein B7X45_04945 [Xanthomonadales bacterium 15-68-25]OZB68212.1 MAG: hypothetical protein B7X39_03315 [Xanthomonadales bacterium 14-68-21]